MADKVSFLILEKSYVIRSGLLQIITDFPETGKVYELETRKNLHKTLKKENPDVLIVNAKLTDDIPDFITVIKEKNKNIKSVVFAGTKRANDNFPGFDLKISVDEAKNDIIEKLKKLIRSIRPEISEDTNELSEREKDIVKQVALGKTNKEISEILFISIHTVMTHRKNITRKLGIKTVSGLTVYAILNNLIKIDETKPYG
ncbi:MAG: response regulator transcription factor [Chlorobi bacterium]|nr:response regulator transcription factor [Chlorobiota bacterium]